MGFREKFNYFEAMERQGAYAIQEAKMLVETLNNFNPAELLEKVAAIHEIENAADQLNHQLFTSIATEFLTPIDREDIAALALRLDDIVDYVDDVLQQLYMYDIQSVYAPALDMANLIEKVTTALGEALKEFSNFKKSKTLAERIIMVNDCEEEADRLYFNTIRDLYTNYTDDPVFIMAWSNMFLRMERCVDSCENVTDMMSTIVLKNT